MDEISQTPNNQQPEHHVARIESTQERLADETEVLNQEMHSLNRNVSRQNKQSTLWWGFLHGIMTALGATLGTAIILAGIVSILRILIINSPALHDTANQLLNFIQHK